MSSGTGFNGSYASHIILRKGTAVIKLPDVISDDLGASINCALATMMNCVSQIPDNCTRPGSKAVIQVKKNTLSNNIHTTLLLLICYKIIKFMIII